jgi:hypothetical protein
MRWEGGEEGTVENVESALDVLGRRGGGHMWTRRTLVNLIVLVSIIALSGGKSCKSFGISMAKTVCNMYVIM